MEDFFSEQCFLKYEEFVMMFNYWTIIYNSPIIRCYVSITGNTLGRQRFENWKLYFDLYFPHTEKKTSSKTHSVFIFRTLIKQYLTETFWRMWFIASISPQENDNDIVSEMKFIYFQLQFTNIKI